MVDLSDAYLGEVKRILRFYAPEFEVKAFGSRVSGKARKFSDLDLVLMTANKLDWRRLESLRQAFSESNLPYKIDVLDWSDISETLKRNIEEDCEVLQRPEGPS